MNRGGGRRVDKALDSPYTSKGCIMRSSLLSCLFLFFLNQVRLHSPHTAGAVNVFVWTRVFGSVVSHSRGYFGLKWVEFRWCISWLKYIHFTHGVMCLSPTNDVLHDVSSIFCYCLIFKTCSIIVLILFFLYQSELTSMYSRKWRTVVSSDFPCLNAVLPSEPLLLVLCPHCHKHTHTLSLYTAAWLTGLLCLHAYAWSRHILNYFLSFMNLSLPLQYQPCLNTHDLAPLVILARAHQ